MPSKAQVKVAFFSAHGRRSHTTPRPFGMGQVHGSLCQWTGPLHSKQSSSTQGSIIYMDHSDIFPPRSRSVLLDFHKLTATYPSTSMLPYVTPTAPPPPPPTHTHSPVLSSTCMLLYVHRNHRLITGGELWTATCFSHSSSALPPCPVCRSNTGMREAEPNGQYGGWQTCFHYVNAVVTHRG